MDIAGQVVVITGAARGIGAALAERFIAEDAAGVCLVDLSEAVVATADGLGERTLAVVADVTDEAAVEGRQSGAPRIDSGRSPSSAPTPASQRAPASRLPPSCGNAA